MTRTTLRWISAAALVALSSSAATLQAQQTRSWMQSARAPSAPTAMVRTATAAPHSAAMPGAPKPAALSFPAAAPQAFRPQPAAAAMAASQFPAQPNTALPSAVLSSTQAAAPGSIPTVYYPLPGATSAPAGVTPTAATMSPPTSMTYADTSVAGPALTAQHPTLAPPIAGATSVGSTMSIPPNPAVSYGPGQPLPYSGGMPPANMNMWSNPSAPMPYADGAPEVPNFDPDGAFAAGGGEYCDSEPSWFSLPRGCGPWFLAVSGLVMRRDASNNVQLTYANAVPQVSILNSEQTGWDEWMSGIETRFGRTIGDRWAIEGVYWTLQSMHEQLNSRSEGNGISSYMDFENLVYQGAPLSAIYDNSREHRLFRGNTFENMEINLLQQAMMVDPAERFSMTMFTGARYFRFDEHLQYDAVQGGSEFADGDLTTQSNYYVTEKNRLVGWQIGTRGHLRVGNRVRLFAMPRFGLFANQISQTQHVCMIIDDRSSKTDVALLGQLDLGLSVQVLPCFSLYGSYRALGISGVASSDDNFARTFQSPPDLASINSAGSLILHGWQMGGQLQF